MNGPKKCFLWVVITLWMLGNIPTASAQIIRDTEIENTLRVFSYPLIEQAGLNPNNIKLILLNDDSLNAFVSGGQNIYMHTGLLLAAEDAEEVIGVLAHELGHIAGGHIAALQEGGSNAQKAGLLGAAIGVPLAILSGNGSVLSGSMMAGQQIAQSRFFTFTRGMESAADHAAIRYLHGANITAKGLEKFMEKLQSREHIYGNNTDPYSRSHPLTKARLLSVRQALKQEGESIRHFTDSGDSMNQLMQRMRGKLAGYLWEQMRVLREFPPGDNRIIARYARCFSYMRGGQTALALDEINSLLNDFPNDPFFLETKGDILRNSGELKQARDEYDKVLAQIDWAALVHFQWANSLGEDESNNVIMKAIDHLKKSIHLDSNNISAWALLSSLQMKTGDVMASKLSHAEFLLRRGEKERARAIAKEVQNSLKDKILKQPEKILLQQTKDIIHASQKS